MVGCAVVRLAGAVVVCLKPDDMVLVVDVLCDVDSAKCCPFCIT